MKKKSLALTVSALALTAVVAVGGTLAYLSDITETKQNVFTSTNKITGDLEEPNWQHEEASHYTPGDVITKDPFIMLTGESTSAYVAMVVASKDSAGNIISNEEFEKNYGDMQMGDGNSKLSDKWFHAEYKEGVGDIYIYGTDKNNLAALNVKDDNKDNDKTELLFDRVKVNVGIKEVWTKDVTNKNYYTIDEKGNKTLVKSDTAVDENTKYYDNTGKELDFDRIQANSVLPHFQIDVTGYLTQSDNIASAEGYKNLINLCEKAK